ncbi:hypothetical protein KUTeg_019978 [Tegillarca granosa]|uniref:Ig-like domain-containing protein n=1 Tax=Tegillarca granosa TaxID=220873 RepID=A0ABQ9EJ41_TEGGR|nr:hypothetical protein KUTeg_019978 [Tegillarca granosa]
MNSPIESVIWSAELMGNADGVVVTGPFKNWHTPAGPLFRNIGQFGSLFDKDYLKNLLTRTRMEEISTPTAAFQYNFEFKHGAQHVFVDGIFGRINTAAYDPLFYIYHCFVDYVYQKFREVSENAGVDIENDWTSLYSPFHAPGLLSGFANYTHMQGQSKYYTNCIYQYEDGPTCSENVTSGCNSEYLWCNQSSARCVSFSETEYINMSCRGQTNFGFVNNFCVGDSCDTDRWVYFPVQVVQFRPPGHGIAKTRRIKDKKFEESDIYEASADSDVATSPEGEELETYEKCKAMHKFDNIIVETNGLNYYGEYQEVAMTDTRLPLSTATVYMAAKKPTNDSDTTFTIAGADKCGRECKIMYRPYGTDSFNPSSGSFRLTNQTPLMYGQEGPEGPKGEPGLPGTNGQDGAKGEPAKFLVYNYTSHIISSGDKGIQGPKGDIGSKGKVGSKGCKGNPGVKGADGPSGDQGPQGQHGEKGAMGDKGEKGSQGPQGMKGMTGDAGPNGADGNNGIDGAKGEKGIQGAIGAQGSKGADGEKGIRGDMGNQGETGASGIKGVQGEPGVKGSQGETGPQGPKGDQGDQGIQGTQCADGLQGPQGPKGDKGDQGDVGPVGPKGAVGPQGPKAPPICEGGFVNVDVSANAGDTITLPCKISGYPKPTVTWTKDGVSITTGISEAGLTLTNVSASDSGQYTCKAHNILGCKSKIITLTVGTVA